MLKVTNLKLLIFRTATTTNKSDCNTNRLFKKSLTHNIIENIVREGIDMNFKKIGKKIADKRSLLGITQEELAEKVNSSANYISNIETGIKSGSLIFYIKVANELKLSLDFLFSEELPNLDTNTATNNEIIEMIDMLSKDEKQMANIFIKNIVKGLIELRNENK